MLYIKFGRYLATPKVINKHGRNLNIFKSMVDSEFSAQETQCNLERARVLCHNWLKDHYGFTLIYIDNQSENDQPITIRLCNYKRMIKELHSLQIDLRLENHILK